MAINPKLECNMKRIKSAYLALAVAATLPIAVFAQDKEACHRSRNEVSGWLVATGHRADVSGNQSEGAADDTERNSTSRARCTLSVAPAATVCCVSGRYRQTADAGHHLGKGNGLSQGVHCHGSPAGMPNWQTSGEMTEKEVDILAPISSTIRRCRRNLAWSR